MIPCAPKDFKRSYNRNLRASMSQIRIEVEEAVEFIDHLTSQEHEKLTKTQ